MDILLLDDEVEILKYLERIFTNYETHLFSHPNEAHAFLQQHSVDIIIADQKLPKLQGLDFIKSVRDQDLFWGMGIIISAYTDHIDLINAVNSNLIYRYIVKPFSPNTILQAVLRAEEILQLKRDQEKYEEQLGLKKLHPDSKDFFRARGIWPLPPEINLSAYFEREEEEIIAAYFNKYAENISRTARALALSRQGLKNKLLRYGIITKCDD